MKIFLCFIFLVSVCNCEDSQVSQNRRGEVYGVYRVDGKYDGHKNYNNKDGHDSIVRPCSFHDVNCIRRVFARNSHCSPAYGPPPDPYFLERLPLDVPQANLTFTLNNAQIKGISGWKIQEFYINKATDRLVLEVEFDRIVIPSPGATLTFYRKGKEPVEVTDYSIIEYNGLSLTLTISNIQDGIQLSRGHVYTYLPDANPRFAIGPAFYTSKDPVVNSAIRELVLNLGLSIREVFVTQGAIIMNVFLQTTICNFGNHY